RSGDIHDGYGDTRHSRRQAPAVRKAALQNPSLCAPLKIARRYRTGREGNGFPIHRLPRSGSALATKAPDIARAVGEAGVGHDFDANARPLGAGFCTQNHIFGRLETEPAKLVVSAKIFFAQTSR